MSALLSAPATTYIRQGVISRPPIWHSLPRSARSELRMLGWSMADSNRRHPCLPEKGLTLWALLQSALPGANYTPFPHRTPACASVSPGLVVKLVVIKIGPSAGLPRPRVVQEERRRQFEHGDHLPAAHCGKSWRKSSMCCPACRCSISERAATRVPPNTGAPPRICGERSIRSG